MTSIKEYVEESCRKDLIADILGSFLFTTPNPKTNETLTEAMFTKLQFLSELRENIVESAEELVKELSVKYKVSIDTVLNTMIYFILVAETVSLSNMVDELGGLKEI